MEGQSIRRVMCLHLTVRKECQSGRLCEFVGTNSCCHPNPEDSLLFNALTPVCVVAGQFWQWPEVQIHWSGCPLLGVPHRGLPDQMQTWAPSFRAA